MATATEEEVNTLFQELLGREAGEEGTAFFTQEGQGGVAGVRESIRASAEFQELDPQRALATGVPQIPAIQPTEVEQIQQGPGTQLDPLTGQVAAPTPIVAAQGVSAQVAEDIGEIEAPEAIEAVQVEQGAQVAGAQGVAIERDLKEGELVSDQIAELTAGLETGDIPIWAQGAVASVDRMLAARGISRSSIGQAELTNAILQTALPIAQANAQALQRRSEINLSNAQQIQVQNLSNEQQAALLTSQQQQQVLLTDQAAENAARQFNSESEQQTNQFNSQMRVSIAQNNASRLDSMEQFNVGQTNAIAQFNSSMEQQTNQFNANMSSAIAQSNVNWRRQANLSDTAAVNAANMNDANARNSLTSQDMANRWQSARDLAHWSFQSSENEKDRVAKLTLGAVQAGATTDAAFTDAMGVVIGYGLQTDVVQGAISFVGTAAVDFVQDIDFS